MKHFRWLASVCLIVLSVSTVSSADEITDAMTSPDPRIKLQSGTGQVYHSAYGDPEDQTAPAGAEELDLPGFAYQRSELYDRSPLDDPLQDSEAAVDGEDPFADPFGLSDEMPPLGRPYARPGIYYQEDLEQ